MVAYAKDFSPDPRDAVSQYRIGDYFCEICESHTANRPSAQSGSHLEAHDYDPTASGMFFYGYRYYDSEIGRWLNRDPLEEQGGLNLYGFVGNDGVNAWDLLGMFNLNSPSGGLPQHGGRSDPRIHPGAYVNQNATTNYFGNPSARPGFPDFFGMGGMVVEDGIVEVGVERAEMVRCPRKAI